MREEATAAGRQQWSHMAPCLLLIGDRVRVEGIECEVTNTTHVPHKDGLLVVLDLKSKDHAAHVKKLAAHERVEVLKYRGEIEGPDR